MHLVVIAWLYVIGTMALATSSWLAGIALFVFVGLGPVLLWLFAAGRRRRMRRGQASGLEQRVHHGDDGNAQSDQDELAHRLHGLGPAVQARDEVGDGDVEKARRGDGEHGR